MSHALYDVVAPAKLNLFLHVIGRRADGYHLIESLFVLIDWFDTMHFEARTDGRLARHDLGAPLPADDLCVRAARLLQAESGTTFGADISIDKRLPSGAGLGGGSSDAASTLLALNRLWRLDWPRARLLALGLRLGADVPFFIGGCNALAEGIGERLTPVELPRQWLAVVKPPASIETRVLFASPLIKPRPATAILESLIGRAQRPADRQGDRGWQAGWRAGWQEDGPGGWDNDLQAAAEAECPEVAQAAALLQTQFGNSRMTGSGSAVFAQAGSGSAPAASMPTGLPAGWAARMCRSLDEHPLVGWASG